MKIKQTVSSNVSKTQIPNKFITLSIYRGKTGREEGRRGRRRRRKKKSGKERAGLGGINKGEEPALLVPDYTAKH